MTQHDRDWAFYIMPVMAAASALALGYFWGHGDYGVHTLFLMATCLLGTAGSMIVGHIANIRASIILLYKELRRLDDEE